jgi:hypothetical protein
MYVVFFHRKQFSEGHRKKVTGNDSGTAIFPFLST